jgi:hypothetical protein
MAEFNVKTADEWFEELVAIVHSIGGLENLTVDRTTDIGAEIYAIAKALALGDIQRALILRDAHPSLASRFGLMLRADELGISYDENTSDDELRAAVLLAERTSVGTLAWYEGIIPMMFPEKVTEAQAVSGNRGPGSVTITIFYQGESVSDDVVEEVQSYFDGEASRLTTDRVYVRSPRQFGFEL